MSRYGALPWLQGQIQCNMKGGEGDRATRSGDYLVVRKRRSNGILKAFCAIRREVLR